MSNRDKTPVNPMPAIVITAIICATIIITVVLGFSLAYEQLSRTTDRGNPENSPVDAVLKAQLTTIITFFTGIIGAAFGGFKLYQKIGKVEKQTNGRSHTRDAERDLLLRVLGNVADRNGIDISGELASVLTAPTSAATPPEEEFTPEEMALQREMMELSKRMSDARQSRINEKN